MAEAALGAVASGEGCFGLRIEAWRSDRGVGAMRAGWLGCCPGQFRTRWTVRIALDRSQAAGCGLGVPPVRPMGTVYAGAPEGGTLFEALLQAETSVCV